MPGTIYYEYYFQIVGFFSQILKANWMNIWYFCVNTTTFKNLLLVHFKYITKAMTKNYEEHLLSYISWQESEKRQEYAKEEMQKSEKFEMDTLHFQF